MSITPINPTVQRSNDLGVGITPWQDIAPLHLTLAPCPEMLSDRGHVVSITCKLKSEPKGKHCAKQRLVKFDSAYVSYKIEAYIYQRLGNTHPARTVHAIQNVYLSMREKLPHEF